MHHRKEEYEEAVSSVMGKFPTNCESSSISKTLRCDRILWYGKGLRQLEYKHIESWLSDHRPVSSTFMAEVEIASHGKLKPTFCKNSKVEAEELRLTTLIPVL
ncbi:hypothetical protein BDL97_20G012600 [Sphagnum fallax]|nr:hypothetical protein BDL97_20G012600 [Sphagnum fallax]